MSVIAKEAVVWMLICQLSTHSADIKITRALWLKEVILEKVNYYYYYY